MFLLICIILAAALIKFFETSRFFWILAWPGTIMHELMHILVGLFLLAQPNSFSIFPKYTDQGVELGSAGFSNLTWYNKLPIAIAPLLGIPLVWYASTQIAISATIAGIATVWILASILSQSTPSSQDWRVGFSSPVGIAAWAGVAYMLIR